MLLIQHNEQEINEIAQKMTHMEGYNTNNLTYKPIIFNNTLYVVIFKKEDAMVEIMRTDALNYEKRVYKILELNIGFYKLLKHDSQIFLLIRDIFNYQYPI